MKRELELILQAYLDHELAPRQAQRLENWINLDKEAQVLLAQLRMTKALLAQSEPGPPSRSQQGSPL
jgi:anti-sigma factor RsiW